MLSPYLGLPRFTEYEATSHGFRPMTHPYFPAEEEMLKRVISDMQRGRIKFALVQVGLGVEVWR